MTRAERYKQVKALRDEGLLLREITARTGLAMSTVSELLLDPSGERARARKRQYERPCADCGTIINPNGPRPEQRCKPCHQARVRAQSRRWIIESMHEWADRFGAPPSATDWNPPLARNRGMDWKADRHEATGRPWPSVTLVQTNYGSWNNGLRAAGFEPLTPSEYPLGHAGANLKRQEAA